jgi:hypothetical protein
MPKQIKTKFPETLYVHEERDGNDTFLVAAADPSEHVEVGVAVPAAEYKLVRAGVVIEAQVTVK